MDWSCFLDSLYKILTIIAILSGGVFIYFYKKIEYAVKKLSSLIVIKFLYRCKKIEEKDDPDPIANLYKYKKHIVMKSDKYYLNILLENIITKKTKEFDVFIHRNDEDKFLNYKKWGFPVPGNKYRHKKKILSGKKLDHFKTSMKEYFKILPTQSN
ncbi:MAG: hypothetical protein OXK80_00760 [Bdellovibrionales bacterium]|nr:hypothetical protein [Bdellovibrionales bacterium]